MTSVNNQSVDSLLKQISKLNFSGTSETQAENVKNELDTLFTDVATYNGGSAGAEKIQAQINELQSKIDKLEEKAQKIFDNIADENDGLKEKQEALAASATDLTEATTEFQAKTKSAARLAAQDAIYSYQRDTGESTFQECFDQAFRKRLGGLEANQSEIKMLWTLYEANRGAITSITSDIENAVNQVNGLEAQLKNVQGTISLLTRTMNIMKNSTVDDAYKNIDTDINVPVFSGAKAELANSILSTYQSRNNAGEASAEAAVATSQTTKDAAQQTWLGQKQGTYAGGDKYSVSSNPELANLRALNESGMIENLQNSGMSTEEIMQFISSNWDVGITKGANGTWNIPKGHSSDAWTQEPVFEKLTALIQNGSKTATADSVNQNQMKELKKAVEKDGILTKMYEAGFTFKEAMYTLNKAFPDAGITYDLSKQNGDRNYSIVADSDSSGNLYGNISGQIQQYWGVNGTQEKQGDDSTTGVVNKFDPITFQDGNTTYTFITDRNGDGKFDYNNCADNELLGSKEGISELTAFDTNGDGKLTGNELKNITLMANNQQESSSNANDVNNLANNNYTNSVDFSMSYTNAYDAGITEISLAGLTEGEGHGESLAGSTKDYDGIQEKYDDINGSSIINQFTIKKDGKKLTGKETLNTCENLNTFYGQVAKDASNAGKISNKLSNAEFEAAFNEAEGSQNMDNILKSLTDIKNSQTTGWTYDGIALTEDDIHNLTGLAYLTGAMDAARIAAENKVDHIKEAKEDAAEAIDDYFETRILGKKEDEDDDDKKKTNNSK